MSKYAPVIVEAILKDLVSKGFVVEGSDETVWTVKSGDRVVMQNLDTAVLQRFMIAVEQMQENKHLQMFEYHWRDGSWNFGVGQDVADAFGRLGYGGGAVHALDFYQPVSLSISR